jgi:hypothetical protein
MRRLIRDHSLSIVALGAFVVIWLGGQAWAKHRAFNEDQRAHGEPTVSFGEYLTRADFGEATFENRESEFLQMGVYDFADESDGHEARVPRVIDDRGRG